MGELFFFIPFGLLAGALAGYLGIGGGPIFLPVLLFALDGRVPPERLPIAAVSTSIGAVFVTSLSSAARHFTSRNVVVNKWLIFSAGALTGSVFGGLVVSILPPEVLRAVIAVVIFLAAVQLIAPNYITPLGRIKQPPRDLWLLPVGVAVGIIAASVGVGGGILSAPILIGYWGLSTKEGAGTSAAVTMILALGAILGHIYWNAGAESGADFSGFISMKHALALGIPAAVGAFFGADLHRWLKPGFFKIVFAVLLFFVAIKILFF